ncbi:hypothetical protein [Stenotrophomonas cyclobalanopsidis]|uniref:hypothetical protein n=1 Tax=Stenotrophomonas cyclobalanopsidis TaxID=2771362 RepID=UPI002FD9E5F1
MAVTIKPFRSNTAGAVPTTANLADGEFAVNTADRKIFMRVGSSIVEVASVASADFITGLRMTYVSANSFSVSSGAAFIPAASNVLNVPSAITKASLSLVANSWYHLYLYSNSGAPDIEVSTVAPATSAYFGVARTKNGDTSRRYVGSILTGAGGAIYRFSHNGDEIQYVTNTDTPFRVLAGGTSTNRTNISLAGVIPPTSTYMMGNTINNGDLQLFIDVPEVGNAGTLSRYTCLGGQRTSITAAVPSRTLQYFYALPPTGAGAFIDVWGYKYDR